MGLWPQTRWPRWFKGSSPLRKLGAGLMPIKKLLEPKVEQKLQWCPECKQSYFIPGTGRPAYVCIDGTVHP